MKKETRSDIQQHMLAVCKMERGPYMPKHIAEAYGLNVEVVYRHIADGLLPKDAKVGKSYEFSAEDILQWRNNRRKTSR